MPFLAALVQPSVVALCCTAWATVLGAAVRSVAYEQQGRQGAAEAEAVTLTTRQVLLVPLLASASLLVMYLAFRFLQFALVLGTCVAAAASVAFASEPAARGALAAWRPAHQHRARTLVLCCGRFRVGALPLALHALGGAVVLAWLLTGAFVLNNILGIALCMTMVSLVRLPNLRVCTLLLLGLLAYDIFWVFISPYIFADNVMVAAATQLAENPARLAAEAAHLPPRLAALIGGQIDLPVKLMFHPRLFFGGAASSGEALILGLGDMALPGMLVALLLSHDVRRATSQHPKEAGATEALPGAAPEGGSAAPLLPVLGSWRFWRGSYALPAMAGYAAGMLCTLMIAMGTGAAQPALLYLVPGTLLAVLARSKRSGAAERRLLWWGEDPPDPPGADKRLGV